MEGDFIRVNKALLPLSWLYGLAVGVRNMLFDVGLFRSRAFEIPVIAVGNITVGGTGKTPHVEYLTDLLRKYCRVAVLSRGYKRKSKGFLKAAEGTTMTEIGDEPYQMRRKFPDVTVAVDKNRCHGIDVLTAEDKTLDVILLDDAFQHRYVKPGINILLVDYHRLIIYDKLLPAGRLREPLSGKSRADIVIVTKCPRNMKPMEYRVITKAMSLYPFQMLFFTSLEYGRLRPVFKEGGARQGTCDPNDPEQLRQCHVLLLTGIASPRQMIQDMTPRVASLTPLTYRDHHAFTAKDIRAINQTLDDLPEPRIIITTEKDTVRLEQTEGLSPEARACLYEQPVKPCFMQEQESNFNNHIIDYVHKNSRNSILVKRKDDHKSDNSHHTGNRPRTISFRNY